MEQAGVAGHFRHRLAIGTEHRAAARVRFRDRPAKSFEGRREKERGGAIVERFEQLAVGIRNLDDSTGEAEFRAQRTE
jgi:hypothetical protein